MLLKKSNVEPRAPIGLFAAIFLILPFWSTQAQEYTWPTSASRSLTSSFAETRPTHFHSGIDIKTWGREGYEVFATRSGYVWRVRISPFGYGRVIYQILDTGEMAVYAHLRKFSPGLENHMRKLQKERNRFSVTKIFQPYEFPVEQGDLIAYTGSTGIGVPHLHFEIRENGNTPTNPLHKGFDLNDTISPLPSSLAVLPLNLGSQTDGWPMPRIYPVRRVEKNVFSVDKPIQIWGAVAFAVSAYDQANGVNNKFSVHHISATLDGEEIFQSTFDKFRFDHTHQVVLDRNAWLNEHHGRGYYNLFIESMNQVPFYHSDKEGQGIVYTVGYADSLASQTSYLSWLLPETLSNSPMAEFDRIYLHSVRKPYKAVEVGTHVLRIALDDFNGNQSVVKVPLIVGQKQKPDSQWISRSEAESLLGTNDRTVNWARLIDGNSWQEIGVRDVMDLFGNTESPLDAGSINGNGFGFDPQAYRIAETGDTGIEDFPIFVTPDNRYSSDIQFDLEILIKDPYAVVQISSSQPVLSPLMLTKKNRDGHKEIELTAYDLDQFVSWFPAYDLANDSTTFSLYFKNDVVKRPVVEKSVRYHRVKKDEGDVIQFSGSGIELNIPANASNQDLYLEMKSVNLSEFELPAPGDSITPVFSLFPRDVPFLDKFEFSISLPPMIDSVGQIGIYAPNLRKGKWNLVSNQYDESRNRMIAETRSLGEFTLLRDSKAPQVTFLLPGRKPTKMPTPLVLIQYSDDLSDIGGEDDFRLQLDGEFCIAELDPEGRLIRYHVEEPLAAGTHRLDFWIRDRAGNETTRSANFTVSSRK